ncbi:MAG: hypothetical protein KAV87_20005 [Desulfobacteraceae bacterium]|nr:hypothetical protein [Desulfobacteraceae bacterium]
MNRQVFQIRSGPKNVALEKTSKIIDRLNSLNTADDIANVVKTYAGQRVLGNRVAQRILDRKRELGRFEDLKQVEYVGGIGIKKFTTLIYALADCL